MSVLPITLASLLLFQQLGAKDIDYLSLSERTLESPEVTIRYNVSWQSMLTPAQLNEYIERTIAAERKLWPDSRSGDDSYAHFESQLRASLSTTRKQGTVTFSYSPKAFFYMFEPKGGGKEDIWNRRDIVYFNGKETFRVLGRGLRITTGPEYKEVAYPPIFGVQVYGLKLFRPPGNLDFYERNHLADFPFRADVYLYRSEIGRNARYGPGYAEGKTIGSSQVLAALYNFSKASPFIKTEFSKYEDTFGTLLAHETMITEYVFGDRDAHPSKQEFSRTKMIILDVEPAYYGWTAMKSWELLRTGDTMTVENPDGTESSVMIDRKDSTQAGRFEEGTRGSWVNRGVSAVCAGIGALLVAHGVRVARTRGK